MCGIAGIIGSDNFEAQLDAMLKAQAHRGPDYTGHWYDKGFAYLGHNRLSIIDLHEHANQPFISEDGRYILVFNGEIYNYLEIKAALSGRYDFKTESDTEVLLASFIIYGESCLEQFRGMFSFVIWDKQEKTLFAARDRFGVKPFNYIHTNECFAFASEIKTFWAAGLVKKEWNQEVLASYMCYASYGRNDETFWKHIRQLPGGHCLTVKNGRVEIKKYYHFEENVKALKAPKNLEDAEAQLETLLLENIKLRLRSDVGVGFNLSGGVDSTLLFQLIRQQLSKDKTRAFTFYSNDSRYDETEWVKEIIGDSGFNWEKVLITSDEIPDFAQKIQHHQDEPYAGIATLAYTKVFEAARKERYIVLLDGSGIDEQFAGYDYYTAAEDHNVQGTVSSPVRRNCLSSEFQSIAEKYIFPQPFDNRIQNLQYRDIFHTKLQRDMRFNDRISMAFSTELREPFLDHKLFEFAFSLPLEYKINEGKRKWIIRNIIRKSLKGQITEAAKRPVQTPQREWLSGPLKPWVNDMVKTALVRYDWLDKQEVQKELDSFFGGNNENSFYIWQWVTLGLVS